MPELPEVETTRRGLEKSVRGKKILRVEVRRYDLRWPIPKQFTDLITGSKILSVRRRAKYLLIDLSNGKTILSHLGMSGSFTVRKPVNYAPKTHDHVIFTLEDDLLMVFHDPRRFGMMDVLDAGDEHTHELLAHLGPEPLSREFDIKYLCGELKKRKGPLKPVLMDQKLVVGVGNIYASESLFLAKINPYISASKATNKAEEIIAAIQTTLNAAIKSGGSTLRDYVGASNEGGYFQHHFSVYGRDEKPCFECGTIIKTAQQAGRATFWCPQCQQNRATRQKP